MPHLTVYALESDLVGREGALISGLTDAVIAVYGDWVRDVVGVLLVGVPAGRWGIGGKVAGAPAPRVSFGIRAGVFGRADAAEVLGRLAAGVTDAVAAAIGEHVRVGTAIEFVGEHTGRAAVGGVLTTA